MSNTKLVIKKGYTLEIVSWENDGDNYKTNFITVSTLEEAKKINKICKELFYSFHNGENGVGNSMDNEAFETLIDYYNNNKNLFSDLDFEYIENAEFAEFDDYSDDVIDEVMEYFQNIGWEYLGGSEYYDFRICEKVTVTYSPEDIYLEEIKL